MRLDLKSYNDLDHGYAATIHKSQGTTVDRAHVLASGHMDRHAVYVALSRHRERVDLHYSREAFAEPEALARALSRERAKDTTLNYRETFAERRGLAAGDRSAVGVGQGRFGAFEPGRSESVGQMPGAQVGLEPAVRQYAKAFLDAERMRAAGLPVLEHQQAALERAGRAVEAQRPGLPERLDRAMQRNPELGAGRPAKLLEAAERSAAEPRAGLDRERTRGRGSDGPRGPGGIQRDRDWDRGR